MMTTERLNKVKDENLSSGPFRGMLSDAGHDVCSNEKLMSAYEALEEKNFFFRSIIDNIESGILVIDINQHIVLSNPYSRSFFNKTEGDIAGRHLNEVCPEIQEKIAAGIDYDEIFIDTPSHEKSVIGFSRFNLRAADSSIIGNIINFKDMSVVFAIRKEMRQKEHLSAMGELVARVAHEMRNPLFGMTAVGQIFEMELQLNPEHKKLLDSFQKEAKRLNTLVEDLLETTRELRIRRKVINLQEIIAASIAVNEIFARGKNIEITSPSIQDLRIWADADKLEQVLVNLIKNAIDATPPDGTICLEVSSDGKDLRIDVIDKGNGISEELAEKIFDVFYTTKRKGTGMGLAISRNIAVAHGGSLSACNNRGSGATFTVTLPMKEKGL